ncbi:MAG: DUF2079 domain-containing protein [Oscillatoriales cyanobacterium RM2_1_1]|nr:DUF2079 domain-containing protein [Oscillatoriales cyanobacterium SM2_3_0]NJO46538.1 DUF2079 domain-containing protein [Oscillatoriales cyanobacterium RM2_1_1]
MGTKWHQNPALQVVLGVAVGFFLISLGLTLHRYFSFYASYDQGIFNQVFWNNAQGRLFQSSLSSALSTNVVHNGEFPDVSYHRLGQHFTPALLLWLPLYRLFPSPVTLTVLQVVLVTAAGLVLYGLAREYLEPRLSAWITVSFYCANAVLGPTLSNFHDICQLPLLIFGLLLAMERRRWWAFWILAVLVLAVREDAGVSLFGVGVYLILSKRYPGRGLALCMISFTYMVALTNLIMPLFSDDISERFMMERFGQYAEGETASTLEIIWGIVSQPHRLLIELMTPFWGTLKYLIGQWLPLAFVPAIAPASWAVAGFPLLKLLIAKGESVLAITIRYAMTVVPGLFYGSILWWSHRQQAILSRAQPLNSEISSEVNSGVSPQINVGANSGLNTESRSGFKTDQPGKRPESSRSGRFLAPFLANFFANPLTLNPFSLEPQLKPQFRRFWGICLSLSLFFTLTSNPNRTLYFLIPDSVQPWVYISLPQQWSHVAQIRPLLAQIPSEAGVAATTYIVPHVSGRRQVLRFPQYRLRNDAGNVVSLDYIIADLWQLDQYQVAFQSDRKRLKEIVEAIEQLLTSGEYGITDFRDEVALLQKGQSSDPEALSAWKVFHRGY